MCKYQEFVPRPDNVERKRFYGTLGFAGQRDAILARNFYRQLCERGGMQIVTSDLKTIRKDDDFKRMLMQDYGLTGEAAKAAIVFYQEVDVKRRPEIDVIRRITTYLENRFITAEQLLSLSQPHPD